jgi:predicted nucleotidyltransferase
VALYTPEKRDEVAAGLIDLLAADERIASVELSGSGSTGYADRWSDVDVSVTVAEGVDQRALADEWTDGIYDAVPVVHHFAVAFGDEHVRGFLLENMLEVDLGFRPAVAAAGDWPGPDPDGEAGFGWHDVLHAAVALARERPWRAQYYIGLVRWRTFALATSRLGLDMSEYKGVDELPSELLQALEAALPRSLASGELHRALEAVTRAFLGELARSRPQLAARLEAPLLEFLDASRSA